MSMRHDKVFWMPRRASCMYHNNRVTFDHDTGRSASDVVSAAEFKAPAAMRPLLTASAMTATR